MTGHQKAASSAATAMNLSMPFASVSPRGYTTPNRRSTAITPDPAGDASAGGAGSGHEAGPEIGHDAGAGTGGNGDASSGSSQSVP